MIYLWSGIFERCYRESRLIEHPNYIECGVCKEWFCFNSFAKWYNSNKWGDERIILEVDKDIKLKRNKIYSPETCILTTRRINMLFVNGVDSSKRNGLIGTYLHKSGKYVAQCQTENKTNKSLGIFDTEIEAFNAYKIAKEAYIKKIADEYKLKYTDFPIELYSAMYSYKVEETD